MISLEGKGGSGKSTVAYLLALAANARGRRVLLVDADLNLAQGRKFGLLSNAALAFGPGHINSFAEYVRGQNPAIQAMSEAGIAVPKMVPPGTGSRLVDLDDPYIASVVRPTTTGVLLLDPGGRTDEDRGTHCWHYNLGAIEQMLIHFVERQGEQVIVDMTAGDDEATALHSLFDVRVIVVEPDQDSTSAASQIIGSLRPDQRYVVVGNKIDEAGDIDYLHDWLRSVTRNPQAELTAALPKSAWVKALSRGEHRPFGALEDSLRTELDRVIQAVETLGHHNDRRMRDVQRIFLANVPEASRDDQRVTDVLETSADGTVVDGAASMGFSGVITNETRQQLSVQRSPSPSVEGIGHVRSVA